MSHCDAVRRMPLVIDAGDLICGSVRAPFREGDRDSLLRSYLGAVREVRDQRSKRTITLREDDLTTLAGHLGSNEASVLEQLLALMGATREQRTALLAMLAAGALTIVATGTIVLHVSADGVRAAVPLADSGVSDVAAAAPQPEAAAPLATVGAQSAPLVVGPLVEPPVPVPAQSTAPEDVEPANPAGIVDAGPVPPAPVPVHTDEPAPVAPPADVPEGQGTTDDGTTVAVAPPPVPPVDTPGIGIDDTGATVAVAPPPVPPVDTPGIGIDDTGATVAVAAPPVPVDDS